MIERFALLLLIVASSGCGYSAAELEAAYRDGHRAGIIWCKRDEAAAAPELDAELLVEWRRGFEESTGIQCPAKAHSLVW